LRVNGGEFEKTLLGSDTTTGRLDTRFAGPTIDPMSKEADYDPQSAAISSAYVSAFQRLCADHAQIRREKDLQAGTRCRQTVGHAAPAAGLVGQSPGPINVMPDLAVAMKQNPNLKVQLNGGYYDLATPYFAACTNFDSCPSRVRSRATSKCILHLRPHGLRP